MFKKIAYLWWLWFGKRGVWIDGVKIWPKEVIHNKLTIISAGLGICLIRDKKGHYHYPNGYGI
jgi:hypothetical protein